MIDRWPPVPLATVCERVTVGHVGPMQREYVEEGIPFLRSLNISPFTIDRRNLKLVGSDFHHKLKKSALQPGDVVIVRTGYPGTAAVIPPDLAVANCADLVVVTPGPSLLGGYLAAYLNSPLGKGAVRGRLVGVAQQHFNVTIAKELPLPLPPLPIQEKVVSILSTYQELIENNVRRIEILEEMAQAIYREWFVNQGQPDSQEGRFGHIASEIKDGVNPEQIDPATPYVGLEHIPRKSIILSEHTNPEEVRSRKWRFKPDDILFGKLRPYFHKVVRAPTSGVCSTDAIVIRPKSPYETYALFVASSMEFVDHATSTAGGTDRPRANWRDLANFALRLPSEERVMSFSEIADPMIQLAFNLVDQNRNLCTTRDLLLPRLISGEIDVSELDIDTSWLTT